MPEDIFNDDGMYDNLDAIHEAVNKQPDTPIYAFRRRHKLVWWREALRDWLHAQYFAWQVFAALRRKPRSVCLTGLIHTADGRWIAAGYHRGLMVSVQATHASPYVAIRRMQREAENALWKGKA